MAANFQPFISQLIIDPQFGYLLPNSLAIAALGSTDKIIRQLREKHLTAGTHYLQEQTIPRRIYYTVAGLAALANHLETDRAKGFIETLWGFVGSQSALAHRPPADLANHTQQVEVIQPYASPPATVQPFITPEIAVEWLQLKRDEIELQRSQEETRRMELIQQSARNRNLVDANDDPGEDEPIYQDGRGIHITNNVQVGSPGPFFSYSSGFVEAFCLACLLAFLSIGCFAALVANSSQQPGVEVHVK